MVDVQIILHYNNLLQAPMKKFYRINKYILQTINAFIKILH